MEISRWSLTIVVTLSLLILCSGCGSSQHVPAATIPAGPNLTHPSDRNTIPAGPSVAPSGTKHFAAVQ
jgi:hypothetical protein